MSDLELLQIFNSLDAYPAHFSASGSKRARIDPPKSQILAAFDKTLPGRFWALRWKRAVLADPIYQTIPLREMTFEGYSKALNAVECRRKKMNRKPDVNTPKGKVVKHFYALAWIFSGHFLELGRSEKNYFVSY